MATMSDQLAVPTLRPVTGHERVDDVLDDLALADEGASAWPADELARLTAAHEALHRVLMDADHDTLPDQGSC